MLLAGERSAGELVAAFPHVSQPAISQHLKVLRDARLVSVRADRQRRFYALQREGLETVQTWVVAFAEPKMPSVPERVREAGPKAKAKPKSTSQPKPMMLDLFG